MDIFESAKIGQLELKNRVVMPPMDMYSATDDGKVTPFHMTHYTTRVLGGVGLVITEVVAVSPEGRISANDLGLWEDDQKEGMKSLVDAVHALDGKIAMQIGHAGRKCEIENLPHMAPSAIDFNPAEYPVPTEMTQEDINQAIQDFRAGAKRAAEVGFDGLEIHAAHGYLIHEFLSPLSNERTDKYGGSRENRVRFLAEVIAAVKEVWPKERPLWIRVSATDHAEGGLDGDEMVKIVNMVKDEIELVHVSTGGLITVPIHLFAGYQVQYAEQIRRECNIPVIAVGLITDFSLAQNIIEDGRADFVALGRELLRNPYWVLDAYKERKLVERIPAAYHRGFR
ncbi:MAG TPA: NADPH dehydrogenase NamA [Clostridiaceae bacterium]|nr:NADPH dehydrogenase NamA [Clostridiaceae bacterium]